MNILQDRVDALLNRARREVEEGHLPSCQIALGFEGEIVVEETFGEATLDTRYCIFSATKPFVASAVWQMIAEGKVDVAAKMADYLPFFGANEKGDVTVEQVMLHTSGFPHAPMGPKVWGQSQSRREQMAKWRLNWEPGTRFEYHASSAHWVLGELIIELTGNDYRDEVHRRVTEPLGLPRVLGIEPDQQGDLADLVTVGEHATPDELEAALGVREIPATEVTEEAILRFNESDAREVGVPGGGGYARARDVALFYQGLLHNPDELWDPALLADVTGVVRQNMVSPDGVPANRALGVIMAGDDGLTHRRGMGRAVSPATFGHNGAGGQLAWADPATGLSLCYVTNGYDVHELRQPRRGTAIGSIAATCAA